MVHYNSKLMTILMKCSDEFSENRRKIVKTTFSLKMSSDFKTTSYAYIIQYSWRNTEH
jgi:hypothetical protein